MRPILRLGSYGPDVRDLQSMLNSLPTSLPRLTVDGAFGRNTHNRVCEYQAKNFLVPDGIVGYNTWNKLGSANGGGSNGGGSAAPAGGASNGGGAPAAGAPAPAGAEISAPTPGVSPGSEDAARQRIREIALKELNTYGRWARGDKPDPQNPKIAGKLCADRATRLRQGGKHLAEIFSLAGAPNPQRCLTLSEAAEKMYSRSYSASERNNTDIVSWCGIFTLYVLKSAGLRLSGWPYKYGIGKPKADSEMQIKAPGKPPQVGDVGIVDPMGGLNHHFVIVDVQGDSITSVDGNSGALMEICEGHYTVGGVKARQGYFIEPIWDRVL